jgi:copper chaperone CopZ
MKCLQVMMTAALLAGTAMAKEAKAQFKVSGMTCGACAVTVRAALTKTKGVKKAEVDAEKGIAIVLYDDTQVNEPQLLEAINRTGFKAEGLAKDK